MIGVGTISAQYFAQFPRLDQLELVAVADLDTVRAAQVAEEQGVRALTVDELLVDDEVDVVLNLTIPAAHADIALRALAAGKHVYGEKPLALTTAEAAPVLEAARTAGLRVGSAPDTVLGTGIQTARNALDGGTIGDPVAAMCQWTAPGHERWHPNPAFYYQPGGGPLLDMGPYYLTALVTLLGPIARVSGVARRSARERTVATGSQQGAGIPVNVDTHVSAVLEHVSGVTSTVTVSFEVWASRVPLFEVYGTAGTLAGARPEHLRRHGRGVHRRIGGVVAAPGCRGLRRLGPGGGPRRPRRRRGRGSPRACLRRSGLPRARGDGGRAGLLGRATG